MPIHVSAKGVRLNNPKLPMVSKGEGVPVLNGGDEYFVAHSAEHPRRCRADGEPCSQTAVEAGLFQRPFRSGRYNQSGNHAARLMPLLPDDQNIAFGMHDDMSGGGADKIVTDARIVRIHHDQIAFHFPSHARNGAMRAAGLYQ